MTARLLMALSVCLVLMGCQATGGAASRFTFDDWPGPPLRIYTVEPATAASDAPVVIVMHGVQRNADEYRDNWIDLAEDFGLRVYVPEFDRDRFPGPEGYNLGGDGKAGEGAFDAIEPLFRSIQAERGSQAQSYYLFGHSAGAQFVHRAICFAEMPGLELAIAANAGWYTQPDPSQARPYGLADAPEGVCTVDDWLGTPLLVMLGTADIDPQDPSLRQTPQAMAQGPNRLERGKAFYAAARARAQAAGLAFNWRLEFVEGVAHDNFGIAQAAAPIIAAHAARAAPESETAEP